MSGIEALISAHLDGGLDDAGQAELDAWIAADAEHQRRFLRAVIEHRALAERFASERALPNRGRTRRRVVRIRFPIAAGVAAALAAAVAGAWWWSPTSAERDAKAPPVAVATTAIPTPILANDAHGVAVTRSGHLIKPTPGQELRRGDILAIDAEGTATLAYLDGTRARIAGGSAVTIADSEAGKRLELTSGRIEIEMAAQPAGHPAHIITAEADVTVVGTTLAVARAGNETAAEVTHGRVSVARRSDGATIAVTAGECAAIVADRPLAARTLGSPAGTTYAVGQGQAYASLDALPELAPGDVVEIHAGTHRTARSWRANGTALRPITIRGVGAAVIDGEGVSVSGVGTVPRALFQIEGAHYVIDGLAFQNARNGENGAAIRCLGSHDTVIRRCTIARCDDGIVAGDDIGELLIEDCDVGWCGTPERAGYCHGVYIGGAHAVVRGCHIHDQRDGQSLKSSCRRIELIANRIVGADEGEMSFIGGNGTAEADSAVTLIGNLVVAKPDRRGNSGRFIEVGDENGRRGGTLTLRCNTFVAADAHNRFIDTTRSAMRVVADGNVFVGSDRIAALGDGGAAGVGNWLPATAQAPPGITGTTLGTDPGFVDPAHGDYHLRADSPVLGIRIAGDAPALEPGAGSGSAPRGGAAVPGAFGAQR